MTSKTSEILINEHIYKEDNLLYPMADEVLSEKVKGKMLKEFMKIEKERKKDKEKYEKFAGSLR